MRRILLVMICLSLLSACSQAIVTTSTPAPTATNAPTTVAKNTAEGTSLAVPTATNIATTAPTATTAAPTQAPTHAPATVAPTNVPNGGTSLYLDDRSTPQELMRSFVNALNRHEYVRAYSYWEANAVGLPPSAQFEQGYANTASVQLTIGTVYGDAGAGNFYYSVPVTLIAQTTTNATQTFVGCYTLHLGNPDIQGTPPFQPLAIRSAQVQQVANNANTNALMANACPANGNPPVAEVPSPQPDISVAHYIDDRSDSVQVLRSLFNAVNRHEYVRAYSYWEANAPGLKPFNQFQAGYANTASVQLMTGAVSSDFGAGQIYYSVPVVIVTKMTNNTTQTFAGCYFFHLARPDIQGVPPFQPLAIRSANIQQVANNANANELLNQNCQP